MEALLFSWRFGRFCWRCGFGGWCATPDREPYIVRPPVTVESNVMAAMAVDQDAT